MTALERQMAADAVALSREHADRADAAEARAEAAEARLAALRDECREPRLISTAEVLAIIGSGEEGHSTACTGCGGQYSDEESGAYLFASREGLERHLHADGWQADPVLCPACQPEEPS